MKYSVQIFDRGESIAYSDSSGALWLQLGYDRVNRLYCSDTEKLAFARREAVVENLCDYFHSSSEPIVFVLDERDKDRKDLESLFARLVAEGHKITLEDDSAEKRDRVQEEMYLRLLRAGKQLVIGGVKLTTEADYWNWKRKA